MIKILEVEPRLREYVPYDYLVLGLPTAGYSDTSTLDGHLATIWRGMMRRCYDPSKHNYTLYGGSGVSVCARWHNLQTFIRDVKEIPQAALKLADWGYQIDKDYYSSNQYSPDTCVWLSAAHNGAYTGKAVTVINPFGLESTYVSQHAAATALGMAHNSTITRSIQSKSRVRGGRFAGYQFLRDVRTLRYTLEVG